MLYEETARPTVEFQLYAVYRLPYFLTLLLEASRRTPMTAYCIDSRTKILNAGFRISRVQTHGYTDRLGIAKLCHEVSTFE